MKKTTTRKGGFTLVEIMIVVAIIGLLAAIAIPNFVKARKSAQTNTCINNLRQIDGAKQQFALEQGKGSGYAPTDAELTVYLGRGDSGSVASVFCPLKGSTAPMSGSYDVKTVGEAPKCLQFNATDHKAELN